MMRTARPGEPNAQASQGCNDMGGTTFHSGGAAGRRLQILCRGMGAMLLPHVTQYLRQHPRARALVCAPTWPHEAWFAPLRQMADEELSLPPGRLQRVAHDAPARLESWGTTIFVVMRSTAAA